MSQGAEKFEKYDKMLTEVGENFSKMIKKVYTRENVLMATEVKETYFQDKGRPDNTTYEVNQILTNLEKMILFVEKDKLNLISRKENNSMLQEPGSNPEPFSDSELETMCKLLKTKITEQEEYIVEMKILANNLTSLANSNQL